MSIEEEVSVDFGMGDATALDAAQMATQFKMANSIPPPKEDEDATLKKTTWSGVNETSFVSRQDLCSSFIPQEESVEQVPPARQLSCV
jgi:hypothetical protein